MITWPITITRQASLWVHIPGECAREATDEDLAAAGLVRRQDYDEAVARIADLEAETQSPAHRQAIDDLCIALAERDAVVDRICEAVTSHGWEIGACDVKIGGLVVCIHGDGPGIVQRIRAEIRKAAACTG